MLRYWVKAQRLTISFLSKDCFHYVQPLTLVGLQRVVKTVKSNGVLQSRESSFHACTVPRDRFVGDPCRVQGRENTETTEKDRSPTPVIPDGEDPIDTLRAVMLSIIDHYSVFPENCRASFYFSACPLWKTDTYNGNCPCRPWNEQKS